MRKSKKIPVIILNGFLGSGKTTLFRNLLYQSKNKNIHVCAIVNDMSALDIDGELLGTIDFIEENKGILKSIHDCVLSSKKGIRRLDKAINKLVANQNPELIIIETSGSCHPMPLVDYFKNQKLVSLNGLFTLVDSLMLNHDFNLGKDLIPRLQQNLVQHTRNTVNLLVEQVLFCSHLILTKEDRVDESKMLEIASSLQDINPCTSIHSIIFGNLGLESLFDLPEYDYFKVNQLIRELKPILEAEENADKPYDISTMVLKDDRPFHPKRLWDTCHKFLDKRIYRSKGFFWLASRNKHSLLWNQAAGGINLELVGSWRAGIIEDANHGLSEMEITQLQDILKKEEGRFGDRHCDLTIIGDKSQVNNFTTALESCFLTDKEISDWASGRIFEDPWPKNLVKIKS